MSYKWEKKKLGEIIKLEYGKPLPSEKRNPKGKFPVYGANGEKDRTDEYYYNNPSIIVGRKGSAGEINFTENKFWPLDVTYFVTYNEKKYNLKFLYHLLSTLNLPKLAKGVKPGINRNDVYSIDVKTPTLPEQKRIVAVLNEAFDSIAKAKKNAEKNFTNAKELFESYLNEIFANPGDGWEKKKLGDFYEITSSKRVFKSEWKKSGVPFYRAREIVKLAQQNYVNNELFISEDMYNLYAEKYGIPKEHDIMVTGVGTLGICYVVKKNDKFYFKDGNIIWFKRKNDINSQFVEYALKSNYLKKQINDNAGATVGTYTIIRAKNTVIPIPTIYEQKIIVAKLDELSAETKRLEEIYRQKSADLDELKQSILNKAFNGEL